MGRRTRRLIRLTGSLALTLLVIGVQPAAASPDTLVVDDDGMASATDCNASDSTYMTIQDAEDDAMPGDTIKVCPGVYTGVFIDVDTLTVLGAKAGVDARTRAFVAADESIIDDPCGPVQIVADNVVFDGFTAQGAFLNPTVFFECFGAGIWTNPGSRGNQGGHEILNNIVQDNIIGVSLANTCVNLLRFNLIKDNDNLGAAGGNGIYSDTPLCDTDIDRNKFSGHTAGSVLVFGPGSNLNITNNELVGGTPERVSIGSINNGTISGNVSNGSTGLNGTIQVFGGNSNITINSNTLFNGIRAIRVRDLGAGPNTGVTAHFNCIDGSAVAGMHVDSGGHTGTLNAENNWWGSPSGPTHPDNPGGTGDAIIDPDGVVDFIPFLNQCPTAPMGVSPKDLVAGTGTIMGFGDPVVHVNASRNPNTLTVKGRFYIRYPNDAFEVAGSVTCLTVNLNKAGVGGVIERVKGTPPAIFGPTSPGSNVLITVLDMGEPGTLDEVNEGQVPGASTNCPSTGNTLPIKQGNYVVKADPPPDLLFGLDAIIAEFETAANCWGSVICSGTGELMEP